MDPNANLAEQESIMRAEFSYRLYNERCQRMKELRTALADWFSNGGFEPDWSKAPLARKYYGK